MRGGTWLQLVRWAFASLILLEVLGAALRLNIASDFTWIGLIVTALAIWGLAETMKASAGIAWAAFLVTTLDALSALLELYSRLAAWDLLMHALGGAIIAAAFLQLMRRSLADGYIAASRQKLFLVTSAYFVTAGVGFLYEFLEYLVDRLQYGHPRSLVSAYDSIEDQLLNLAGATIVLIGYHFLQKRRSSP